MITPAHYAAKRQLLWLLERCCAFGLPPHDECWISSVVDDSRSAIRWPHAG